jgi:hypothetical protein
MITTTPPYSFKYYSHLPQELKDRIISFTQPHPIAEIIKAEKNRLLLKHYYATYEGFYLLFDSQKAYYHIHTYHNLMSFQCYFECVYEYYEIEEDYDEWESRQYFNKDVSYTPFLQYQFSKFVQDEYITLEYLYFAIRKEYRFKD